ncbi:hypothetical protein B0T10DRAFT_458229 [Thelonectria olida]|uniref:Uncharacterized protein n=1 Tax=Thelonectria olida TaxID=1576542 RepID=A0A9P8W7M9_9HYPO|nr:hypothetical protein B0T10DRAFT_458229 [Thelonectria olida]
MGRVLYTLAFILVISNLPLNLAQTSRARETDQTPTVAERLVADVSWLSSGDYAGDCNDNGGCALATECSDGTIYYDNDSSTPCGTYSCISFTLFQTSPNGLPSATNIDCRPAWSAYTVYRELVTSSTSSALETSSTSAEPSSTSSDPSRTTSTILITLTTSAELSPESQSSGSKAWIAGAAVGAVAGIALLLGSIWFLLRRRKQAHTPTPTETTLVQPTPSYSSPESQYTDAGMAESHSRADIPATTILITELPDSRF